mgnify:CR=1 FL=1
MSSTRSITKFCLRALLHTGVRAKRHWFRLNDLSLVPESELQALIRRSYDLVVAKLPKKVQATLAPK